MKNNRTIYLSLLLFLFSCTKVIEVENSSPSIDSIVMENSIQLLESDTLWHEINLYISDNDGFDDIDSVIFYVRRDSLYNTEPICELDVIEDVAFSRITDFPFLYTTCTGYKDSLSLKNCEELSVEECGISEECILNISDTEFLYYMLIPFKPLLAVPGEDEGSCGRYGKMSFQFLVKDLSGTEYLSSVEELDICGWECIE